MPQLQRSRCPQVYLPLEEEDLAEGRKDRFEIEVSQDLGQLEALSVSLGPQSPASPWHLDHVEMHCPEGTTAQGSGLRQDKTRQEITYVPASLADQTSDPLLGSIPRILLTPASRN